MVIDGAVVITGSFNFTKGAAQYTRNWEADATHSEPYTGRGR